MNESRIFFLNRVWVVPDAAARARHSGQARRAIAQAPPPWLPGVMNWTPSEAGLKRARSWTVYGGGGCVVPCAEVQGLCKEGERYRRMCPARIKTTTQGGFIKDGYAVGPVGCGNLRSFIQSKPHNKGRAKLLGWNRTSPVCPPDLEIF